jgi:Flp pilus assembly pilin Flp
MRRFLNNLGALAKDDRGATVPEYGLIADRVAVVIVIPATMRGTTLIGTFATIAAALP